MKQEVCTGSYVTFKLKSTTVLATALFFLVSNYVYSQTDSLRTAEKQSLSIYAGFGAGICNSGAEVEIGGTLILRNNWGMAVRYNSNTLAANNVPADYVDLVLFMPFLSNPLPLHYIDILSVNALREFSTNLKYLRFGIEAGPALVMSRTPVFIPDPDYVPLLGSNYIVTHEKKTMVGFSLKGKIELPVTRFFGFEVGAYANLNPERSVIGVEININLGLLR